jgi:AraC family transcriptional regulator
VSHDLEQVAAEVGTQLADAPDFERYDSRFDPRSGDGEVEIWVPLKG